MAGAGVRNTKKAVELIILELVLTNWINEGIDKMKVIGIECDEVFWYLKAGREVYAIDPVSDKLINLKFETVDIILDILDGGLYAYFTVNHEERN